MGEPSDKPISVTVLAVFNGLFGLLSIITGLTLLITPNSSERFQELVERLGISFGTFGIVFLMFGIAALSVSWAFWALKPWARNGALVLVTLTLVFEVATYDWLYLGFSLCLLFCLFLPSVKSMFPPQAI